MNEWRTPAYHSRATLRWKIPYTMKFFSRVGTWSHRRSWPLARNKYRIRRYSFRPKIDSETTRKRVGIRVEGAQHHAHSWESALPSSTRGSRFLEGQYDSFRILFPDAPCHLRDLRFRIDFVIRLGWHLPNFGVRGDDHQDDLGRVLIEESGQPFDRGPRQDGHRFDEEQDGSAPSDDRGRVLRRGAGRVPNAEPGGPVFVRESLSNHPGAPGRLEF